MIRILRGFPVLDCDLVDQFLEVVGLPCCDASSCQIVRYTINYARKSIAGTSKLFGFVGLDGVGYNALSPVLLRTGSELHWRCRIHIG